MATEMQQILMIHTLQILLLAVTFSTLCSASDHWYETCEFDKYVKDDHNIQLVEELATSHGSGWKAFTATTTEVWEPIRILVSRKGLHDEKKYCKEEDEQITNFMDEVVQCGEYDIFTDEERKKVKRIIRSAVTMHTTRLKVKPIKNGYKVPTLKGKICSSFNVPETHQQTGVLNADMVLYVEPLSSNSFFSKAIAVPCAKIKDGRPVVGGIFYNIAGSYAISSTVRVAAHHIAHVLGFSYSVMSQNAGVKLANKTGVRNKDQVLEVTGTNTVNFVKEHFDCQTTTGMELEDEMGELQVVSHSHWERRNARDDLMSPVISKGRYSPLTLALFTDLGYYQGQMDKAESMQWGYGTKCNFLEKPCLGSGKTAYPTMFCANTRKDKRFCDENLELMECSSVWTYETDVPSYFDYFSDTKKQTLSFADNCPIIVHNGAADCKRDIHSNVPGIVGQDSLCFEKATESKDITTKSDFEGMCVKIEPILNNEIQIIYEGNNKVTCVNNKATLGNSYSDVVLKCPTFDEIAFQKTLEEAILPQKMETADELQEEIIQDTTQKSHVLQKEKTQTDEIVHKTPREEISKPSVVKNSQGTNSNISEKVTQSDGKKTEAPSLSELSTVNDTKSSDHETKKKEVKTKTNERETKMSLDSKNSSEESTATSPHSGKKKIEKTDRDDEKSTSIPLEKKNGNEETNSSTKGKKGLQNVNETNIKSNGANESKSEGATGTVKKLPNIEKVDRIGDRSTMHFLSLPIPIIIALITLWTIL